MRRSLRTTSTVIVVTVGLSCLGGADRGGDDETSRIGSAGMRGALFDSIVAMTERREAFSPIKEETMGFSAIEATRALRSQVVDASSEVELYYALVRVSNARRDHHLDVSPVEGGLRVPDDPQLAAPIGVLPDYSDLENPSFFIAAVDEAAATVDGVTPSPGDRIVTINGRSVPEYVETFTPWVVHSSIHGLYWDMARDLPRQTTAVPPWLYGETLDLQLERETGERYVIALPYVNRDELDVPDAEDPPYPGFTTVLERLDFNVLLPDDGTPIVLIQWLDFEYELIQDVIDLMEFAEREELLEHALVIDVTNSSGGSRGAYALQRLVNRPFRTTFGNIRLSDAGERFIRRWRESEGEPWDGPEIFGLNESGSWLREWARTDATEALERGDEYTAPVPFKLAHLPKDSDGILEPAPVHFSGPIAIIDGPRGGSHLDQFVAMLADNDLGYIVGMPTGGYSNTWEATDVLTFPGTDRPVVEFMWNIGHTIRPNGEILEGNPVQPDVYIPLTRANFRSYHQILLDAALEGIGMMARTN